MAVRSRLRPEEWRLVAYVVTLPLLLFVVLQALPGLDVIYESLLFHIIVVSLVSGCALIVAALAGVAAARARQPAVVLLAVGCLCVGFFMLAHGLTTPIVAGRPFNLWVARTPRLAIASFAVFIALSTLRPYRWLPRLVGRSPWRVIAVSGSVVAALFAGIVAWPEAGFGATPLPLEEWVTRAASTVAGLTLVLAGLVYYRRWQLGRDAVQLALVLACFLSAEALVSLELGKLWRLSWWDYHGLLLAGFGAAVFAVFTEYRRVRTIDGALEAVFLTDPLDHIARGYPETLQALVAAVEAKDVYTHGHSERVAEMAVRIGQRMSCSPEMLRRIAQGAVLHDIGKIGVPDHVLNKAGALTPEEWGWIKQHPVIGEEIAARARSLRHAVPIIRHHHERLDGQGYPDGLDGDSIPVEARIVAVADVWDAIRSDRAYRPAWPVQRALDHMLAGRGEHFDPECLDAFLAVLASQGIRPAGEHGDVAEVLSAAETCHHTDAETGRRRTGVLTGTR